MDTHWGVDSWTPVNHPIRGGRLFFDSVTDSVGQAPEFWGRYLNEYRYRLTKQEISILHERGCKILLVFNGPERRPLTGPGAYQAGRRSADKACQLARGIGIIAGTRLYADLEGWPTDVDWFRGWCEVMAPTNYLGLGGIYGNAVANWSWVNNANTGSEGVVDRRFDSLLNDILAGRSSKSLGLHFWSTRPVYAQNQPLPLRRQIIPSSFNPHRPPLSLMTETVIWQYRMNVTGIVGGTIDLDLSTEIGFMGMYS